MNRIVLSAALLLALPMVAQTAKPKEAPTPTAAAPVISDKLKAEFFKAQSFSVQASAQAEKAQNTFQNALVELKKICGDNYALQSDQTGDPVCVAKPPTEKK
jgi:hypothetical protein